MPRFQKLDNQGTFTHGEELDVRELKCNMMFFPAHNISVPFWNVLLWPQQFPCHFETFFHDIKIFQCHFRILFHDIDSFRATSKHSFMTSRYFSAILEYSFMTLTVSVSFRNILSWHRKFLCHFKTFFHDIKIFQCQFRMPFYDIDSFRANLEHSLMTSTISMPLGDVLSWHKHLCYFGMFFCNINNFSAISELPFIT